MNAKYIALIAAVLAVAAAAFVIVPADDADATNGFEIQSAVPDYELSDYGLTIIDITFNMNVESISSITITGADGPQTVTTGVSINNGNSISPTYSGNLGDSFTISVTAVSGGTTYSAEWPATTPGQEYTVTFVVEGAEFHVTVEAGQTVPGNQVPAVPDNFDHWSLIENGTEAYDPTSTPVNGDITLYAVMTNLDPQTYTITWVNYDGTTLATTQVAEGEMPVYTGQTPTKADDAEYTYTFAGWDPVLAPATADATYTAKYTQTAIGDDATNPDRTFTSVITLGDNVVINAASGVQASLYQEVLITGNVTVIDGGWMNISGKLTIAEGASLTLMSGAEISINASGVVDVQGDLIVEGAKTGGAANTYTYNGLRMTVSGNVYLEGADSFFSQTGKEITISGLFEVGDEATAQLDGAIVAQGGQLGIYGVAAGAVENTGTITIDSQGFQDGTPANGGAIDMTIEMKADATVDVINAYGKVVITDAGLTFDGNRANTGIPAKNDSTITLDNTAGVLVTETLVITQDGDKAVNGGYVGTNTMYLSGTVTYAIDYNGMNEAGNVLVEGGNVEIADTTVITNGSTLTVNGNLTVSGDVTATNSTSTTMISGTGPMTVTGKVTVSGEAQVDVINAAKYSDRTNNTTVYTTLETALTDGATDIDLLGKNTVQADATIPVGTTVDMNAGSTLTVAEDATLTVGADGRYSGRLDTKTNDIYVEGTMVVQDMPKSRIDATHVHSDTEKQVEDTMTYTNIYNALENAADGENVEITQAVTLKQDVEVRSGVTLYVPSTMSLTVPNEITVTVNGTLYVAGTYTMAPAVYDGETVEKAPGATVVSGMMVYTNGSEEYTSKIVGASFGYAYTYENRAVANAMAIAPMASVPSLVDDIITSDVVVYGDQTVPAVDFSAYDGEGALDTVSVAPGYDVTFESITIGDYIALSTVGDLSVSGTVVLANGTVELDNVNGIVAMNQTNDIEETVTSFISGTVGAYDDPETEAVETGAVSVTGEVATTGTFVANVPVDVPAGATLTVNVGTFSGDVSVEGDAVIAGTGVTFQKLTVTGTVSASDATINATAVKMYVGVTSDDYAMAGTGSVSGVTLANVAKAVAYVSPNATVEGDLTDLMSTAYYADDELYLTAYARNADVPVNEVQLRIENARFDGWMYVDAAGVSKNVEDGMMVGGYNLAEVYADIERNIYNVTIYVDSGIGSVAIDGNVLVNRIGNGYETTVPLAAGQHTVSYTLKSGYEGEATLTVNGENATVSGLNFTLSGTPESAVDQDGNPSMIDVTLSLSGTTPADTTIVVSGGSSDDGLGLTEILLIILVILIVIMAIIVALRLMRS